MSDSITHIPNFQRDRAIRVHLLARYWYCAAESKLRVVNGIKPPFQTKAMGGGLIVDDWLKGRPKSPFEKQLFEKIGSGPFKRVLRVGQEDYMIIAHPDDLGVDLDFNTKRRIVFIDEWKTAQRLKFNSEEKKLEYDPFSRAQAEFQVRGYSWVMRPTVEAAGHDLADYHHIIIYRRRDGRQLLKFGVHARETDWEREASNIIRIWLGELPLIPPSPMKCKVCNPQFKNSCPLWAEFSPEEKERRTWKK
jgi:hypothetical protein